MRTKSLTLSAAAVVAGAIAAHAQNNVYSVNVVGYVNVPLVGGAKYTAVANPLNAPTNTLGALFASLPAGTQVLKYNPEIADYEGFTKTAFGSGWSPVNGATTSLAPGEGVLVLTTAATAGFTNTFVGEVLQGDLTNSFGVGYKLVGNVVPDAGLVNTLQLTNVPTGSQLLKWDVGIQDFNGFTKTAFGAGWSPSVPSVAVGEAFFINANAPFNWVRNFTVQ
jgi:hypothetical protein